MQNVRRQLAWRPMTVSDLPAVNAIAAAVHLAHPEDPAVFAERLALCPAGCLALTSGGEVAGYLESHPWRMDRVVPLNALIGPLPSDPDTWYIHDLALLPSARGADASAEAIAHCERCARQAGLSSMSLVAIAGADAFWARRGFAPAEGAAHKSESYGADAVFMVKLLP